MGSPAFGMLPGNNAPPPPFFAGNNPTGGAFNFGGTINQTGGNSNFPNYPMFGSPNTPFLSTGAASPMYNSPLFGVGGGGGIQSMSSGINLGTFGGADASRRIQSELGRSYGRGLGSYIYSILTHGLFNPQVASSFLNAMQPSINRGEGNILSSFGAEGSRFGSAASLGQADFLSQANLNEQQTLAQMFLQSQQEQMGLLENILPTTHAEQANHGGFLSSLLPHLGGMLAGGIGNLDTTGASTGGEQILNLIMGMAAGA